MSGKADERFTGGGVDSLEQKLLSKKLKSQEQLEEVGCLSLNLVRAPAVAAALAASACLFDNFPIC